MAGRDLKVQVTDQTSSRILTVELPEDVNIQRLVQALVTKMRLPPKDSAGAEYEYRLAHESKDPEIGSRMLGDHETPVSAGVKDGDTLRLLRQERCTGPVNRDY
jgi:hypothetical protein